VHVRLGVISVTRIILLISGYQREKEAKYIDHCYWENEFHSLQETSPIAGFQCHAIQNRSK